ncbi:helix-turn-helix domain-containing protein [Streptomyces nondiastaticus]|uniref:GlxA family transcriptional regulator n=1 Tax=Streptomyces nondiastaticus TaxID=3154512 RepID=UPI00342569E9
MTQQSGGPGPGPGPGSVAVAVTEGMPILELAVPCHVFGTPHPDPGVPWYDFRLCNLTEGEAVPARQWFTTHTPHGYRELVEADTVIVPASADVREDPPARLLEAVREAHDRGARIVSLCSGAFVLAAAGLLDGRRAATHWQHAPLLAERYPEVDVDPTVLYIDDGDILTSAGSTAGIDLCLHVLRKDLGSRVAGSVARHLVVPAHRPGGQAQYIETPVPPAETDSGLAPLLHWAAERLHQPLTAPQLARQAGTSVRTLVRRFHRATGTTPLQWLQAQRISRAKELLETTDQPMDKIAEQCGLGGAGNLRLHFARSVGIPPSEYRRAYRAADGGAHDSARSAAGSCTKVGYPAPPLQG